MGKIIGLHTRKQKTNTGRVKSRASIETPNSAVFSEFPPFKAEATPKTPMTNAAAV